MKLSEAFDQIEVSLAQAQAIISVLVSDLRDGSPDLHQSILNDVANMQEPQQASVATTKA